MAAIIVCDACGRVYHVAEDSGIAAISCSCGRSLQVPGAVARRAEPLAQVPDSAAPPLHMPTGLSLALWLSAAAGLVVATAAALAGDLAVPLWVARLPSISPWAWFAAPAAGLILVWLAVKPLRPGGMAAAAGIGGGAVLGLVALLVIHAIGFGNRLAFRAVERWLDWRVGWALIGALSAAGAVAIAVSVTRLLPRVGGPVLRVLGAGIGALAGATAFSVARLLPALEAGTAWADGPVLAALTVLTAIISATVAVVALDVGVKHQAGTVPYLLAIVGLIGGSMTEALLDCSGVRMLICLLALPLAGGLAAMAAGVAVAAGGSPRRVALGALGTAALALAIVGSAYHPSAEAIRVRGLIRQARESQDKLQALRELRQVTDPSAIRALLAALEEEEDWQILTACGLALGDMGDRRAVPALMRLLEHDNPQVRSVAMRGLVRIGDPRALAVCLEMIRSDDEQAAMMAARALGAMPEHSRSAVVELARESDARLRVRAMTALGMMEDDPAAMQMLLAACGDPDPSVRAAAAMAAPRGPAAFDRLAALLRDPDASVRLAAVTGMGRTGDPRAAPLLAEMLAGEEMVARAAASALGDFATAEGINALDRALADPREQVVQAAAWGLAQVGGQRATEALVRLLLREAGARSHQNTAVSALINMKDVTLEPLITLLGDANREVRERAESALEHVCEGRPEVIVPCTRHERAATRAAAVRLLSRPRVGGDGRAIVPLLVDSDKGVREAALAALRQMGERAVPALGEGLKHADGCIATASARLLAEAGGTHAVDALLAAAHDKRADVAAATISALGRLGDARAAEVVVAALEDPRPGVALAALKVAGRVGATRALRPLLEALAEGDAARRAAAAEGLGGFADAAAIDGLVAALGDSNEDVRKAAVVALGVTGEPAISALVPLAESPDDWVRVGALGALARMDSPRAKQAVQRAQAAASRRGLEEVPPLPLP
ncbi:MAG: HEAT repeat domain-containing protein [Armatimonadota bacterium]